MARYAQRCLLDAPRIAQALTRRMALVLPAEYPVGSKQQLLPGRAAFVMLCLKTPHICRKIRKMPKKE